MRASLSTGSGLWSARGREILRYPCCSQSFLEAGHCLSDASLAGPGGVKRRKHLLYRHNHNNKDGLKQFKYFLTGYEAAFGERHQLTLETAVQSLEALLCDKEGIQTLKKAADQRVRDLQLLANIQGWYKTTSPELAKLKADEDIDRLVMIAEDKQIYKARGEDDKHLEQDELKRLFTGISGLTYLGQIMRLTLITCFLLQTGCCVQSCAPQHEAVV